MSIISKNTIPVYENFSFTLQSYGSYRDIEVMSPHQSEKQASECLEKNELSIRKIFSRKSEIGCRLEARPKYQELDEQNLNDLDILKNLVKAKFLKKFTALAEHYDCILDGEQCCLNNALAKKVSYKGKK